MTDTRTETDSFGPLEVPADKYWGAQTQRSIINFPIGWEKQPVPVVRALGVIKQACAMANKELGSLDPKLADAITRYNEARKPNYIREYLKARCQALRWIEERSGFKNNEIVITAIYNGWNTSVRVKL